MDATYEGPLAGKVALVTGGSGGIGAAIAKRSTRAGNVEAALKGETR